MTWQLTSDAEEFRRAADEHLAADAARHSVLLTVSESLRREPGPSSAQFGWWRERPDAPVTGAFFRTPPLPPFLGPLPARAATELVGVLRADSLVAVTGVRGTAETAAAFARAWTGRDGGWTAAKEMRLYRLGEPTPQLPAPRGRVRPAAADDVPLVARWLSAFAAEVGEPRRTEPRAAAEQRVAEGRLFLWDVEGSPVSMAGVSPLVAGQIRIAPVYTPAGLRGRGYAGAVTAAAGEAALRAGAQQVVLFADLANPTSNALYQRLGYRPVADFASLSFEAQGEGP